MKAAPFAYHRPDTVAEAVQTLAEFGDEAKVLAGGQSLIPLLAMRLTHFANLVDVSGVPELCGIDLVDDEVVIGAGTALDQEARRGLLPATHQAIATLAEATTNRR